MNKKPSIVIVGAGLAGLTIAHRLHQQGYPIQIYEAQNRIGGRVFSININGKIAELGGQNITDGGESKNILNLVKEFNLETEKTEWPVSLIYHKDNNEFSLKSLLKDYQFKPNQLKEQLHTLALHSKNMKEVLLNLFSESSDIYKMICAILASYEGGDVENLSVFYTETLYHILLGGISHAHGHTGEEEVIFEHLGIKSGNVTLAKCLSQDIGERLHLNHVVHQITKKDQQYRLSFKNGKEALADILVLTMPCKTYEDIVFGDSIIGSQVLESIRNVHYGTHAKIIVPISYHENPLSAVTNGRLVAFYSGNKCALNLYYFGEFGIFTGETLGEKYRQDIPLIAETFEEKSLLNLVPIMAEGTPLKNYERPVGYSWAKDPFAKGSYSFVAPGQGSSFLEIEECGGELVKTMFKPIDNSLFFAGEHASVLLDVAGTMEAAVESGERTARMIVNVKY